MNTNFHQSLDEECLRFLNAIEPGLVVPIQHHLTKDEAFLLLRGKVCVTTYNDDGAIIDSIVLNPSEGNYGVNIDKNVWHTGFVLSGIDTVGLLQSVDIAVELIRDGHHGIPVPDYVDEKVSTKVLRIIQSYVGVVNKMVPIRLSSLYDYK